MNYPHILIYSILLLIVPCSTGLTLLYLRIKKLKTLNQIHILQAEHLSVIAEEINNLHMIQHDLQNHYLTLLTLLESGQSKEAKRYIHKLNEEIRNLEKKEYS